MAESQSMTTAEVVAKTLIDEHSDFLREAVRVVARELIEAEITDQIGARRGELSEERTTHRNGYRPAAGRPGRRDRPAGLAPPSSSPAAPASRRSSVSSWRATSNGVSTRKVDRLVEELGISAMSKDRVSRLCRDLDERVEAFRNRPLEGAFPYLWLDAKHLWVRDRGSVKSKALVVAYAVHETGRREVIGIDLGEVESEAFWVEFLRELRSRGLSGVELAISDQHLGLKSAIARILDCPWQRCTVHFVRNMHRHCRRSDRGLISAALREIFDAESLEAAKSRLGEVAERFRDPLPKISELLEAAEEDLLAFYRFPRPHWSKLRSTNPLERLNKEIGRRSDVVGIFPNDASALRLIGALMIEQNDEWWSVAATYRKNRSLWSSRTRVSGGEGR